MAVEILSMREEMTWSCYGLVLQLIGDRKGMNAYPLFRRLGTFVFEVNQHSCQREDESDEQWEARIRMELDWFRGLKEATLELA